MPAPRQGYTRLGCGALRLGLLVREEHDTGDEDDHRAEDEEQGPGLIGVHFVIENLIGGQRHERPMIRRIILPMS